jgi:putative heme-binding domain-containing protein
VESWTQLLTDPSPELRRDAVRSWRQFKDEPRLVDALLEAESSLVKQDNTLKDDLAIVPEQLKTRVSRSTAEQVAKDQLAEELLQAVEALSPQQQKTAPLLGRRVFERSACVKCHTTVSQDSPRAPSLKGIGKQKLEYVIESVLHPSKVIKTGFLMETVVTTDGKVLNGLVHEEGESIRVLEAERETLLRKDQIDERQVLKKSLMPEGQEQQWSRSEFVDLIAYLRSLK